jgi:hypothetical protein
MNLLPKRDEYQLVALAALCVNAVASDNLMISFNCLGNLTVKGVWVDGTPPSGVKPEISMQLAPLEPARCSARYIERHV